MTGMAVDWSTRTRAVKSARSRVADRQYPSGIALGSLHISVAMMSLLLASCDNGYWSPGFRFSGQPYGSGNPYQQFPGTIQQPSTIDLYPSNSGNRLFVFVTGVGAQSVTMPLVFDTGSAGITLYAPDIGFPPTMLTTTGFVFPSGQDTLTYNGITVTNQVGTKSYGGRDGTVEVGNIGYAQVTFGDNFGQLTTATMPVFLYYSITQGGTALTVTEQQQQGFYGGLFGVNTEADPITVGSVEPGASDSVCTLGRNGPCYTVSVLKYFQYGSGLDAGFLTAPAPLQECNITAPGICQPIPALTVGLTAWMQSSFSEVTLSCPTSGYLGPQTIAGYLVCQKAIPGAIVALKGVADGTLTGNVLFDSGTPDMQLYPSNGTFPTNVQQGTSVLVTMPSRFVYTYVADESQTTETTVSVNANNEQTHIGVAYFTTNSFLIDYSTNTEGWM